MQFKRTEMGSIKEKLDRNSLAVQWLGLGAFNARAWFRSLVRELRSQKLPNSATNDNNNNNRKILYDQERQSKVKAKNNDKHKGQAFLQRWHQR